MNEVVEALRKNLDLTQNKTLNVLIYEAFHKTIILGDIPANTRINEKVLAEELNISRTPIRLAMKQLVNEKLVQHVPKIGIVVKGIRIKDAYEIYDIRKSLDTLATIKAMNQMTKEDFFELKELLLQGERYNQADQTEKVLQNFSDFNTFIYEKSQMLRLKSIVLELQAYLVYFRDIAIRSSRRRDKALEEHWLIYRGMQTKNVEQITLITHEHLDRSLQFILAEMERRKID
ncbi:MULTISPECIES: GntR family transcriptional regulator [unclassified Enterococcus]|uniref:GntR family transcriptional regulator n=1 Tax=unclassified Enterococcus TaxID=2608891 RepID=UPI001A9C15DF|nr:GntR family transcriptional regulator [Enterococcus sp. DIV1271a]MBO1300199.1 GntR family transcriptional regulator [Enterococcus sp. DIV1271a]